MKKLFSLFLVLALCAGMAVPALGVSMSDIFDTNPHTYLDAYHMVNDKNELWQFPGLGFKEKIRDGVKEIASKAPEGYLVLQTDNQLFLYFQGGGKSMPDANGVSTTIEGFDTLISTDVKAIIGGESHVYFINMRDELCCRYYDLEAKENVISVIDTNVRTGANRSDDAFYIKNDGSLWMLTSPSIHEYEALFATSQTTVSINSVVGKNMIKGKLLDNVVWFGGDTLTFFALRGDNSLWGWGYTGSGQLGVDPKKHAHKEGSFALGGPYTYYIDIIEPVKIMDGVSRVFTHDSTKTHAVTNNGDVITWGGGSFEHKKLSDMQWLADVAAAYEGAVQYNDGSFVLTADKSIKGFTLLGYGATATQPTQPTTPTQPIAEVPSSWAASYVTEATALGLVPEQLQGKYTQATTRAEFCALAVALYETATGTAIDGRLTFNDTTDVNVEKMAFLAVVNGTGNGNFDPDAALTREQAAAMLSRLAEAMDKPLPKTMPTFSDSAALSSWAVVSVGSVQVTGVMTGVGENTFAPKSDYTREQSIITILRLFNLVK